MTKARDVAMAIRYDITHTRRPGQKMPSLRDLAADHQCARHTVRKALDILHAEGLIDIRKGAGVFVTGSKAMTPRWHAVDAALREAALQGTPIPAADELAGQLGVSRSTVLRVVRALIVEGIIIRAQKRGAGYEPA
jgi:DNA-binding GntR family transcriptional regulator